MIGEATEAMNAAETDAVLDERLAEALGRHSIKDAAALVAAELGLPKRDVYARALALAGQGRLKESGGIRDIPGAAPGRAPPGHLCARPLGRGRGARSSSS